MSQENGSFSLVFIDVQDLKSGSLSNSNRERQQKYSLSTKNKRRFNLYNNSQTRKKSTSINTEKEMLSSGTSCSPKLNRMLLAIDFNRHYVECGMHLSIFLSETSSQNITVSQIDSMNNKHFLVEVISILVVYALQLIFLKKRIPSISKTSSIDCHSKEKGSAEHMSKM